MSSPRLQFDAEYDTVELRTGRLHRIHLAEGRVLGEEDRMAKVVKCYCRSNDVLTAAEAELQRRPTFVFPSEYFSNLELLIGRELEGRVYADSRGRRLRFLLDLKEHAGFQSQQDDPDLLSPWYDDSVVKE